MNVVPFFGEAFHCLRKRYWYFNDRVGGIKDRVNRKS